MNASRVAPTLLSLVLLAGCGAKDDALRDGVLTVGENATE
jgi:hypothetical protein